MANDLYNSQDEETQIKNMQIAQKEISEQEASQLESEIVNINDTVLTNNISGVRNTINKLTDEQLKTHLLNNNSILFGNVIDNNILANSVSDVKSDFNVKYCDYINDPGTKLGIVNNKKNNVFPWADKSGAIIAVADGSNNKIKKRYVYSGEGKLKVNAGSLFDATVKGKKYLKPDIGFMDITTCDLTTFTPSILDITATPGTITMGTIGGADGVFGVLSKAFSPAGPRLPSPGFGIGAHWVPHSAFTRYDSLKGLLELSTVVGRPINTVKPLHIYTEYIDTNLINNSNDKMRNRFSCNYTLQSTRRGPDSSFNSNLHKRYEFINPLNPRYKARSEGRSMMDGRHHISTGDRGMAITGISFNFLRMSKADNKALKNLYIPVLLTADQDHSRFTAETSALAGIIKNDEFWRKYIIGGTYMGFKFAGVVPDGYNEDQVFTCRKPYELQHLKTLVPKSKAKDFDIERDLGNASTIELKSHSNYELPEYNSYVNSKIDELLIPNFYSMVKHNMRLVDPKNVPGAEPYTSTFYSIKGIFNDIKLNKVTITKFPPPEEFKAADVMPVMASIDEFNYVDRNKAIKDYFKLFVNAKHPTAKKDIIVKNNINVVFPYGIDRNLNDLKKYVPFYNSIKIPVFNETFMPRVFSIAPVSKITDSKKPILTKTEILTKEFAFDLDAFKKAAALGKGTFTGTFTKELSDKPVGMPEGDLTPHYKHLVNSIIHGAGTPNGESTFSNLFCNMLKKNFIDKSYTEGLDVKNFVTNTKSKNKSMNEEVDMVGEANLNYIDIFEALTNEFNLLLPDRQDFINASRIPDTNKKYYGKLFFDSFMYGDDDSAYRHQKKIDSLRSLSKLINILNDNSYSRLVCGFPNWNEASRIYFPDDFFNKAGTAKYSETIGYRIEKLSNSRLTSNRKPSPIQNAIIMKPRLADNDANKHITELEYIDTQIKKGQPYTYNIYEYKIVFGYKYRFMNPLVTRRIAKNYMRGYSFTGLSGDALVKAMMKERSAIVAGVINPYDDKLNCLEFYDPYTLKSAPGLFDTLTIHKSEESKYDTMSQIITPAEYMAQLDLVIEPVYRIYEIPLVSKELTNTDHPPHPLEVRPYQRKDDSQIIGFHLLKENFTKFDFPHSLNDDEKISHQRYLNSQNLINGEKIIKDGVSKNRYIEIYRTDKKPDSIEDFNGKLVFTKDLILDKESSDMAVYTDCFYEEKIKTNTKFYYTFRAVNTEGIKGQFSAIYETELIDDGNYKYAVFNKTDLTLLGPAKMITKTSKTVKKLMQILPTPQQLVLKDEHVDYTMPAESQISKIRVGPTTNSIWDRKFKFRLTSKKTGKKVDLNITYKIKD